MSNSTSPSISMSEFHNRILLGKNAYCRIEYEVPSSSSGCSSIASCAVAVHELDLAQGKIQDYMEIVQTSFTWSQCAGSTGPLGHFLAFGGNIDL